MYIYIYVVHFFGLENKLYKMHGTYIRIKKGIIWNANLLQQGNFIDVFLARHVSGTYAHHQEH